MATITKNTSGNWKAIIRKVGWPTTIKTFRTKRDAVDWARRTEDEMTRGLYICRASSERMTVRAALERYLAEVSARKKESTCHSDRKRARGLIAELGDYSLAALSPDLVAKFRDDRLNNGASPNTVRLDLALLSHLYTIAIKEWRLGLVYNPVANILKPSTGNGRDRRLTRDEEKRLLAECQHHSNPMLYWMVKLALETGMRAGEIQSLSRSQLDLERRIVRLSETKNGSARTVPLTREAANVLREALNHPVRQLDSDLVFWGESTRGGQRRPYKYHSAWRDAVKRAAIENLRFHDLRHEAVSRLVEAGLADQEVAAISGHKSMQMLKRYTHLRAEDLVAKLDASLS